jgi:hypothetical protein
MKTTLINKALQMAIDKRLHSFCDYQSPVKFENEYYKSSKLAA